MIFPIPAPREETAMIFLVKSPGLKVVFTVVDEESGSVAIMGIRTTGKAVDKKWRKKKDGLLVSRLQNRRLEKPGKSTY